MNLPFSTFIIRNPFVSEHDKFEKLAENCVKAGVTHLTFTEIERSYWEIDDPLDPYLNWSIVHTSIFKIFPPEILSEWVPDDYAARARKMISVRAEILKKTGLKGAAFIYDPLYWPEKVFREHPELRGPRTDNPDQCIHPRFAPCVDHPEVLALYRRAFLQLYELSGGVLDIIILRSNDSGTGFCWANLYNGKNGPSGCRDISHRSRINSFLSECLGGVKESCGQTRIFLGGGTIASGDMCDNREHFAAGLPPECGFYSHARTNLGGERILSGFISNFPLYPIRGIPNPLEILEQLASAKTKNWPEIILFTCPSIYGNDWEGDEEVMEIIRGFNHKPRVRLLPKTELALEAASELYGRENADNMVEAWSDIYRASVILQKNTIALGDLIFYGSMAQRWLTRPLVVFPERLSEDEKIHYKPYLYQPGPAHENLDLLDQSNKRQFDGMRHLDYFNKNFDEAFDKYRGCRERIAEVCRSGGPKSKELASRMGSLEILMCFLLNIKNCVNFQIILEDTRKRAEEAVNDEGGRRNMRFSEEKVRLCELIRSEIDNSLKLADLLAKNPSLLEKVDRKEHETAFIFGPETAEDLKRKTKVMLAHYTDVDELTGYKEK